MKLYGGKSGFVRLLEDQFPRMSESDATYILRPGGSLLRSTDFHVDLNDRVTLGKLASIAHENRIKLGVHADYLRLIFGGAPNAPTGLSLIHI